jgi:hypothetical protein
MSKRLWIGAAVIIVTGTVGKQLLWLRVRDEVSERLEKEDSSSKSALKAAYEGSKQYSLKPLTDEERLKLKHLHQSDISKGQ